MMRIPYSQVDDGDIDVIDTTGSIQTDAEHSSHNEDIFCPSRPILRQWPQCLGLCQLIVGFVCVILGLVEVLYMPMSVNPDESWILAPINNFGAVLMSGVMLVLSGSMTVRAAKTRKLLSVQQFFIVNLIALMFNVSELVVILVYTRKVQFMTDLDEDLIAAYKNNLAVPIVGEVFCALGCMVLAITVHRYCKAVLFGEVQLLRSFGHCCFPCCCNGPPSEASSRQSVNSNDSNMIV